MVTVKLPDALLLLGFALLATGLALWSVPLALVVVGGLMMVGGVWSHLRMGGEEGESPAPVPPAAPPTAVAPPVSPAD